MTTRGQNLRSSTPGQIPAAGTRQPGEIWMNFPDKQLGIIDTTKTAQKMLAVRFFSTSASYVAGEFVVQAGGVWVAKGAVPAGAFTPSQWNELAYLTDIPALYVLPVATTTTLGGVKPDGVTVQADVNGVLTSVGLVSVGTAPPTPVQPGALWYDLISGQLYVYANDGTSNQWVIAVNQNIGGGVFLPMTGGTLTGPLTLAADPTTPLMAATKQYVDGGGSGYSHENRIINGDMRIDQRGIANGASGTVERSIRLTAGSVYGYAWQARERGSALRPRGRSSLRLGSRLTSLSFRRRLTHRRLATISISISASKPT